MACFSESHDTLSRSIPHFSLSCFAALLAKLRIQVNRHVTTTVYFDSTVGSGGVITHFSLISDTMYNVFLGYWGLFDGCNVLFYLKHSAIYL